MRKGNGRLKQIGVTLPPQVRAKLAKVATIEAKSQSALAAEAISIFLDDWLFAQKMRLEESLIEEPEKKSVFRKAASQVSGQRNHVSVFKKVRKKA